MARRRKKTQIPKPTPRACVRKVLARLKRLGDPVVAEQTHRYFKSQEKISAYGVSTPQVRGLAEEILQEVRLGWSLADAVAFCELLARERHLESKGVGFLVLGGFQKDFERSLLAPIRKWLESGWYGNWAATDGLCACVLGRLVARFPELTDETGKWTATDSLWLRRASAVCLTGLARRGQQLDRSYRVVEQLLPCKEDLIHKAMGWLLREAGRTDPKRLESFLLTHASKLPRTALRYAIERFPVEKRKMLLEQTRSKR